MRPEGEGEGRGDRETPGRWDRWYRGVVAPATFGDPATYALGADFLAGCRTIEDWGCGTGGLRAFVDPARYRGIDGSASPFADEVVDLRTYRTRVDGVFLRHVLEHNRDWRAIRHETIFYVSAGHDAGR